MSVHFLTLGLDDKSAIQDLESTFLADMDPMERELLTWSARFRPEALEFYLPLGWSFGGFDGDKKLVGYFLAQPLLFFGGLTQTLWVEHLAYKTTETGQALLDLVTRLSKEKHLQRVLLAENFGLQLSAGHQKIGDAIIEIKTSRFVREND